MVISGQVRAMCGRLRVGKSKRHVARTGVGPATGATKAVPLPDGKVLVGRRVNRSPGHNVNGIPCTYEEREGLHFQMFDPATSSFTKLARTTVSRGLHGMPDATVFFAGENREALVRPTWPCRTQPGTGWQSH
jgi:hypothetical protein